MTTMLPALVLLVLLALLLKKALWGPQKLFARTSLTQLLTGMVGLLHYQPEWESFDMTVSLCLILSGLATAVLMLAVENLWMVRKLLSFGKGR